MSEIPTRDEFDELAGKLEDELRESISCKAAEVYYRKNDLSDARDAILAAFDAQAEHVVELEAERDAAIAAHNVLRDKADVAITRVEEKFDRLQERAHDLVDSGRHKQDRITELEAACNAALNWRGLDGDGISQPALDQLRRAVGLPALETHDDNPHPLAEQLATGHA